ncbi:MAG: type IV toxin-antitoxin system AbiEi family antitoxin domain-containing protein [Planctomycetes bacterium]|nr:type IV toxin-antitoxin system AbiEi family antitoxin domain-containing protein [Planctomycetota bacterium]
MPSIEHSIVSRIEQRGRGTCFTPKAFLDLGSSEAVRITLHRLVKRGFIRRLARGLYDFPKQHRMIGTLSPHPDEVARALSERDALRLQPSGAYAANVLGLSEQVPARIVFLTDGPPRRVTVGNQEIILKSTTPRNMATAGRVSGTVIQALRHIGAKQLTDRHITHLQQTLSDADKAQLRQDRNYAPGWVHPVIDAIAGDYDA